MDQKQSQRKYSKLLSSDHSGQEPEGLPVAFNDEDGGGDNSNDEMRKNRFKGQKVWNNGYRTSTPLLTSETNFIL